MSRGHWLRGWGGVGVISGQLRIQDALVQQRTPNRYPCDTAGFLSYSEVKPASLFDAAGPAPVLSGTDQVDAITAG